MSEHNRAIRMAQKLLRHRAERFQGHENANREWVDSPNKRAYQGAADDLEALIEDEPTNQLNGSET